MRTTLATLARMRAAARARAWCAITTLLNGDVHKFSSTQVDLPPSLADAIRSIQTSIPEDHLAEDGLEQRPHVTLKYGIHSDSPEEAVTLLAQAGPISLTLGATDIFEADDYDVVYARVRSPQMMILNALLTSAVDVTDTHPTYQPHATIAYVKKGLGQQYAGNNVLVGMTATVEDVRFISRNGVESNIRVAAAVSRWAQFRAARQQIAVEFTDRYQAMGLPYPNPNTMCLGQCEGMGWVPVHCDDTDPVFAALWRQAEQKQHADDGWHFVKCPECNGTGLRVAGGKGSGNFGHSGRPGEVGGSTEGGAPALSKNTFTQKGKLASEISGQTPNIPVKTIRAYHVTKRENVESILKNGFDMSKISPRWMNDFAVSLSRNYKGATEYFSKVDPKTQKPEAFDNKKYALLEVTVRGRLGSYDELPARIATTAREHTQDVVNAGFDGQDLDQSLYIHNPKAITRIREVAPKQNVRHLGGPGSGNFGHSGRPGEVGGSSEGEKPTYESIRKATTGFLNDVNIQQEEVSANSFWEYVDTPKGQAGLSLKEVYRNDRPEFEIHWLTAMKRGSGRAALEHVTQMADKHGVTLSLWALPLAGQGENEGFALPKRRLEKFYREFGFKKDRTEDRTSHMTRPPRKLRGAGGPGSGNFGHSGRPGEVGGSAGDGATLGPRPKPIKVDKVKDAIPLILQGKTVELKNVKKVNTLLTRLAKIAKDAERKGEAAPKYDACQIVVPGSSIFCGQSLRTKEYPHGLPRIIMPQFAGVARPGSQADKLPKNEEGEVDAGPEFVEHLAKRGISSESVEVRSDWLKPAQAQLDGPKIAKRVAKKEYSAGGPIFISRDGYIVDGHHRWAAVVGRDAEDGKLGDSKIRAVKIDAPISEILHIANTWTKRYGLERKAVKAAGGPGSGNFGHGGRPGQQGGSSSDAPLGVIASILGTPKMRRKMTIDAVDRLPRAELERLSKAFAMAATQAQTTAERMSYRAQYMMVQSKLRDAGGPGSGNFGHSGRPGEIGGSGEGGGSRTTRGSVQTLKSGKVTDTKGLSGSVNKVLIVTLADDQGKQSKAIFKPVSGEAWTNGDMNRKQYIEQQVADGLYMDPEDVPLPGTNTMDMNEELGADLYDETPARESITNRDFSFAEREAAAYDVDVALGTGVVPATTVRTVNNEEGAAQAFIERGGLGLGDKVDQDSVYGLAIIDIATGNTDRHMGNYLVDKENKVVAVDHGLTFPSSSRTDEGFTEFRPMASYLGLVKHQHEMSPEYEEKVRKGLNDTDWNALAARKWPNMDMSEREMFLERINKLKEAFDPDMYDGASAGVRQTLYDLGQESMFSDNVKSDVLRIKYGKAA